jgi:hypothetical protein
MGKSCFGHGYSLTRHLQTLLKRAQVPIHCCSMAAGHYWFALNKALVTLPRTLKERVALIKDVKDARKALEEVQKAGEDVVSADGDSGDGVADNQEAEETC